MAARLSEIMLWFIEYGTDVEYTKKKYYQIVHINVEKLWQKANVQIGVVLIVVFIAGYSQIWFIKIFNVQFSEIIIWLSQVDESFRLHT